MPHQIASLIFIGIIIYLFWIDRNYNEGFSKAIWLPFSWLFFAYSGKILQWLNITSAASSASPTAYEEGNPFNRNIYFILIILGIIILSKRKVVWRSWFTKNPWIWLYFIYGFISICWSDYPFVSFKRLVKASGTVIMTLVILTESRPYLALGVILKRLSFILLPLSVLFIKYYPQLARVYTWTGEPTYAGTASSKNSLGTLCLVLSIYLLWNLLFGRKIENETSQKLHYSIYLIIISMIIYLFNLANSATSTACLIISSLFFLVAKHSYFTRAPNKIIIFCITSLIIFGIIQELFNVKDVIITMLGRRPDLTTRVPMWRDLLSMAKNPITGFGYESFWLGERLVRVQSRWGYLLQAHNGYIEMYLNMGYIGVFFILCWVVSGLINVKNYLSIDYPGRVLRLCLIIVVLVSNYTEASFYGTNIMWMLFFIGIMIIPEQIKLKEIAYKKQSLS